MSIISEQYGRLITSREAADILTRRAGGVRTYTYTGVNRMVSQGRLTPVEKIGGANFFRPEDVERVPITPKRGQPSTRTRKGIGDTGIGRTELARRAGVAETTVWNAFAGRPITAPKAEALLHALNALRAERGLSPLSREQLGWQVKT